MEEAEKDCRPSKRRKLSDSESTQTHHQAHSAEQSANRTGSEVANAKSFSDEASRGEVKVKDGAAETAVNGGRMLPEPWNEEQPTREIPLEGEPNGLNESVPHKNGHTPDSSKDAADSDGSETSLPPPEETAPLQDSDALNPDGKPMSKNQQKKLRKKQEWELKRDERKLIRKEKIVAKRERKRAERNANLEDNEEVTTAAPPPSAQKVKPQKAVQLPITIMIDCDFDDLMRDNERISLAAQITRSYSDNKNSMFRAHLTLCSFGDKLRERFDTILTHYKSWKGVRTLDCDFVEAAEKAKEWMLDEDAGHTLAGTFSPLAEGDEVALYHLKEQGEVVYLTSEAEETLAELKPYSTYIIGGLVDKNREKGICYKRATQRGVRTARLPIGEFMDMQSRKVLATNHVNEIMLKWLECGDWGEAFVKVIPKRKGGKLKEVDANEEPDDEI